MQPTPPPPPPPPDLPPLPPATPQVSPFTGEIEMVQIPVSSIPRSAEQLQGMRVRAEEIQNQIERAADQRKEITEQLQGGTPSEARPGLEQQLRIIDARIAALEQDLTTTNRLVTAATPEAHAQWQAQEHAREARRGDDDEAEMFFLGGGGGILLALFAVAVRRRFRRGRDVRRPDGTVSTVDDPRIDRLGQAVDAIALEVERIGEGQRFVTQLLAEERDPRRLVGARPEDAIGQPRR
jgi:hypothetical protein